MGVSFGFDSSCFGLEAKPAGRVLDNSPLLIAFGSAPSTLMISRTYSRCMGLFVEFEEFFRIWAGLAGSFSTFAPQLDVSPTRHTRKA
jgi:hypothetical protein